MVLAKFKLSTKNDVHKTRYYIAGPSAVADANYIWYDQLVSVSNSSTFSARIPYYDTSETTYYYVAKSNYSSVTTITASATTLGGTSKTAADDGSKTNAWTGSIPASTAPNTLLDISPAAPTMAYITYSGYTLALGDVFYSDGSVSKPNAKYTTKTAIGILGYIAKDIWTEKDYGGGHALVLSLTPESNNKRQWGAGASGSGYTRVDISGSTNVYNTSTMLNATTGYANTYVHVPNAGYQLSNFPALYYGVENGNTLYPTPKGPGGKSTGWFLPSISQWCKVIASPGIGGISESALAYGSSSVSGGTTAISNINSALTAAGGTRTLQSGVNSGVYWTSSENGSSGQDAVNIGLLSTGINLTENGYGNYKYDQIQLWSMLAF